MPTRSARPASASGGCERRPIHVCRAPGAVSERPAQAADARPLVLHVVHRFDTGGLENGIVNLINHMPEQAYRHAVLAVTEVTGFRDRVQRQDVRFHALNKPPGQGLWVYPSFVRLLRDWRPAVVHTRNLAALEMVVPAWLARVPVRIHGEHGWDNSDLEGSNRTYRLVRRAYSPFVSAYVALSRRIESYLTDEIGVGAGRGEGEALARDRHGDARAGAAAVSSRVRNFRPAFTAATSSAVRRRVAKSASDAVASTPVARWAPSPGARRCRGRFQGARRKAGSSIGYCPPANCS